MKQYEENQRHPGASPSRVPGRKRFIAAVLFLLVASVAGLLGIYGHTRPGGRAEAAAERPEPPHAAVEVVLACPGRVEGMSELVGVGAGVDGVLASILVTEGQQVSAGRVVALIDRQDLADELRAATAAAESARQVRTRLIHGSRDEERSGAAADTVSAQAVLKQAELRYRRMERLFNEGVVSADTRDEARRDLDVAEAKLRSTRDHEKLVNATPLPEELAKADADVKAADARVASARASLEKCKVKAPISGTILRCEMKAGETVSTVFPKPIITMADASALRVRAEVDERDIGRVSIGWTARIISDAFPGKTIEGKVSRVEGLMGRKKVRTGDPAEKSDRDVLEVLVDLQPGDNPLVIGLRVTVQFLKQGE
jgi:HlyD family secretion protein